MTEQLTIVRLGHRGDGVADTATGPIYVPYTLPGEVVTVEAVAGHPDRRHLDHVDRPSHERATPIWGPLGEEARSTLSRMPAEELRALIDFYRLGIELNERHIERVRQPRRIGRAMTEALQHNAGHGPSSPSPRATASTAPGPSAKSRSATASATSPPTGRSRASGRRCARS